MTRTASSLVLLLATSVLAGCAADNSAGLLSAQGPAKKIAVAGDETLPTDVDGGVREAQLDRVAGRYDQAIRILSQLMLVAADDPRVVGEYGKTLAEKGRAQEANQFLARATELQPRDWTLYSALGVSYDELGQPDLADKAYDRALALKPGEPSILNNYALSALMAKDPAKARQLMAEAEKSGGASDPKIARNIALVNALAEAEPQEKAAAVSAPGPAVPPAASATPAAPAPEVVMEPVPADPLAGPVKPRPAVPKAKPAVPQEKTAATKPEAEPGAIPDLRDTASVF